MFGQMNNSIDKQLNWISLFDDQILQIDDQVCRSIDRLFISFHCFILFLLKRNSKSWSNIFFNMSNDLHHHWNFWLIRPLTSLSSFLFPSIRSEIINDEFLRKQIKITSFVLLLFRCFPSSWYFTWNKDGQQYFLSFFIRWIFLLI